MKEKVEIKAILLAMSMAGSLVVSSQARAEEVLDIKALRTLETLSPEERKKAHEKIQKFFVLYGDANTDELEFVFDSKGNIYVINKSEFTIKKEELANPSCIGTY